MTSDGFEALQAELKTLKSEERPNVIDRKSVVWERVS
jgi:transcription elongation GreA/GreB family factor